MSQRITWLLFVMAFAGMLRAASASTPVDGHHVVGGPADFGYSRVLEDFNWNAAPSPVLSGLVKRLDDNGDGSGRFTIRANGGGGASIEFYNAPYAYAAVGYPYLRMRLKSSFSGIMDFWPSPADAWNRSQLEVAASAGFVEVRAKTLRLFRTSDTVLDGNGLRIDPVAGASGSEETLDVDYLVVDAFPTKGVDEFDGAGVLWTAGNVDGLGIQNYDTLTGSAGAAAAPRVVERAFAVEADAFNAVEIRAMRGAGAAGPMRLHWRNAVSGWHSADWKPVSDGAYYSYMVDLAKVPEWGSEAVTDIRIEIFDGDPANAGLPFGLDFVRLRRLPELGSGFLRDEVTSGELLLERFEPDWGYLVSKLRFWRSIAGQGGNNQWRSRASEFALRHEAEVVVDGRNDWWDEQIDVDGDGDLEDVVAQGGTGQADPEAAAEAFFQTVKTIASDYKAQDPALRRTTFRLFPVNAFGQLLHPLPGVTDDYGFYQAAGDDYELAYDMAVDCYIRMLQKLKADPVTSDIKVYCYNALHVWGWDDLPRNSTNIGDHGDLKQVIDKLLAANAAAFPAGDSPLVGFGQDYLWEWFRGPNGSRKLGEYMEYVQERGFRFGMTAHGIHADVPDLPQRAYEAVWRYVQQANDIGVRPDEVHTYNWREDYYVGDYESVYFTEEDDAAHTYMAAVRRAHERMHHGLPPSRPLVLAAEILPSGTEVRWEANPEYGLAGYHVDRASDPAGPFTRLTATPVTGTAFLDTAAPAGTLVYYRVSAVGSGGAEGLPGGPVESASAGVSITLLDDSFDGQSNPGWLGEGAPPLVSPDDDDDADPVPPGADYALEMPHQAAGNGSSWLRYFRTPGKAVTLYEGDRLTLRWEAKQSAIAAGTNFLRFGLVDSKGDQLTTHTAYDDPAYADDTGYQIVGTRLDDSVFPYHHPRLMEITGGTGVISSTGSGNVSMQGTFDHVGQSADEWTPVQEWMLERRPYGWQMRVELGGSIGAASTVPTLPKVQRVVHDVPQTRFDGLWLRYRADDAAIRFFLDNVGLSLDRAPGRLIPTDYPAGTSLQVDYGQVLEVREDGGVLGALGGEGRIRTEAGMSMEVGADDGDAVFTGALLGDGILRKTGSGRWGLSDTAGFSGLLVLKAGVLELGGGADLSGAALELRGGTLEVTGGEAVTAGALHLAGPSSLALGDGGTPIVFADSSGLAWSGTLSITGTAGPQSVRFGAGATGLSPEQMASITLNGGGVKLDAGGYLQPLSYAEQWRLDYFGSYENTGLSADDANFDGDPSLNLFERAFHTDPTDADDWFAARLIVVEEGGVSYPALEYRQIDGGSGTPGVDYSAGGMTYAVEVGFGALSWQSGAGFVQLHDSGTDNGDGSRTVRVRSVEAIDAEPLQFMRLRISETP